MAVLLNVHFHFSGMADPLFRAQARYREFQGSEESQHAWDVVKAALTFEPLLAHPGHSCDFPLDCGKPREGLGAVLLQQHEDEKRVVAYAAPSLLDYEKRWSATGIEAAALIWALETFGLYIEGVKVTIRANRARLEYIKFKTNKCKRLERWALRMQEFHLTIQPPPGFQLKHVHALSRAAIPVEPCQQPIELDVFYERAALLVAAWEAQAAPARLAAERPKSSSTGLICKMSLFAQSGNAISLLDAARV